MKKIFIVGLLFVSSLSYASSCKDFKRVKPGALTELSFAPGNKKISKKSRQNKYKAILAQNESDHKIHEAMLVQNESDDMTIHESILNAAVLFHRLSMAGMILFVGVDKMFEGASSSDVGKIAAGTSLCIAGCALAVLTEQVENDLDYLLEK